MSDSFIDAVLKQSAATQGGDDEEFLSEVEAAIDREDSKSKSKRYLLFLPCGAVLLALFLFPLFLWESSEPIAALAATNEELVKTSDSLAETQTRSAAVRETTESGEVRSSLDNGTDPSLIVASAGTISVDSLPGRGHGQVVPIVIDGNNKTQDRVIRRELPRESNSFDTTGVDKGEPFRVGEAILVENTPGPRYSELIDNVWTSPATTPLSTFSIDVDTASWTNVRNMIRNGAGLSAIPSDAVRIEEMINYFSWDYDQPEGDHPFALATEISDCPWNEEHQLLRIGIQGEEVFTSERPKANLVFLIDVSGSMDQQQKLPLVKQSIRVLTEELDEDDRISIVVYAGSEGLALPTTPGSEKAAIHRAIENLNAGGSTNGGAGIKLAYRLAKENRIEGGVNRVILCTDGDFNVGVTGTEELAQLVETGADEKIAISVLGFGQDNLNDGMLETITNRGDGNYFYIDSFREARKVFLSDLMGTLVTIARDVKIQIEFNPAEVESYRLIGYANRRLNKEDFDNDEIDAGDIGAGHSVTALYEIVPNSIGEMESAEPALRYQQSASSQARSGEARELAFLKLRYKLPEGDLSTLVEKPIESETSPLNPGSTDQHFAAAVTLFGLILRDHPSARFATMKQVLDLAEKGLGEDPNGYRSEFFSVVRQLRSNHPESDVPPEVSAVMNGELISESMLADFVGMKLRIWLIEKKETVSREDAEVFVLKLERTAAEDFIEHSLLLSRFEKLGGEIKEEYVDTSIDKFIETHFGGDTSAFEARLRQSELEIEEFRQFKKEEIAVEAIKAEQKDFQELETLIDTLRRESDVRIFHR